MAVNVRVEKQREEPCINGTILQSAGPNSHTLLNAESGVIVPDIRDAIISEKLRETINMFLTD
jgi:hypothetical protein